MRYRIRELDPATYRPHPIHGEGRVWQETNCYVDVVVELLHGLGFEPTAALPFAVRIDFEGDQWTFFKFAHADLLDLYSIDVQELQPWRSLVHHVAEQVRRGHPVLIELDSYFLPDTRGTAYQLEHVKSTVAVNEIDVDGRVMGYFHNQAYHHLTGDDFEAVFQTRGLVHERMLPPYVEFLRLLDRPQPLGTDLLEASIESLTNHLGMMPESNPFVRFRERFEADMDWLLVETIEAFHAYSFATFRQFGSCFELAETYVGWLAEQGIDGLDPVGAAYGEIARTSKTLQFQLARSMARGRPLDLAPLDAMAARWAEASDILTSRFSR